MKDKVQQYVDTSGSLGSKELVRGIWYVRHKLLIRKILLGLLTTWCVITAGIGIFVWGKYVSFDVWNDRDLYVSQVLEFPNYTAIQPLYEARQIVLGDVDIFRGSEDTYDFVTSVSNPNTAMIAFVTFHYEFPNGQTPPQMATLLPGRDGFLTLVGFESDAFPSRAQVVIDDIAWDRINPHFIQDPLGYMDARLQFLPENLVFTPAGVDEATLGSRLTFDLTNNSVYSYWQADFLIELFRGSQRVGVLFLAETTFTAGETRSIDYQLFQNLQSVSRINVTPLINVFDDSVFLPVGT